MIGKKLGHYDILSLLGVGGMGEVYRAHDTHLRRDVAIKVLPREFTGDPMRLARFEREAHMLASLNHPNIAAIYGFEELSAEKDRTLRALVLEIVEGETLADRIARGPVPIQETLSIAKLIAEALEAAHEKGITHRDLKPANIKVRPDGHLKLLDFGIAKALIGDQPGVDLSQAPTATSEGALVGTPAYMSPEQARGHAVDKRTDVWAFGCVVYEMLTGKPAFAGQSVTDILAQVLKASPDFESLEKTVPSKVVRICRRCLEKDVFRRFRDIGDVRHDIEEAIREPGEFQSSAPRSMKLPWIAAATSILTAAVLGFFYFERTRVESRDIRVEVTTPPTNDLVSFALSPDGKKLVYVARVEGQSRLWLRSLDSTNAQPLRGTEGALFPFFSPDSRSIAFFADRKLKRIEIAGGSIQVLANAGGGRGGTWNKDGIIVFAPEPGGSLYRISAGGGESSAATRVDAPKQISHKTPHFLPDGRHFVFYSRGSADGRGVYVGSLDSTESQRVCDADALGAVGPSGNLFFLRQGTLFAGRLETSKFTIVGDPIPIARDVASDDSLNMGAVSASIYDVAYRTKGSGEKRQLIWFDRSGRRLGAIGEPEVAILWTPQLSPDGKQIAVDRTVDSNRDIWLMDVARGVLTRLTSAASSEGAPVWSPDGATITFFSNRKGINNLYQKRLNADASEDPLMESSQNKNPMDWSADGRFFSYTDTSPATGADVWVVPLFGDRKPFPVANSSFDETQGQFSTDVRWIAYQSNESQRPEIYVQAFPTPSGKSRVSIGGGVQPRWRKDGKELFYVTLDGKLMAAPISLASNGDSVDVGTPTVLFAPPLAGGPIPNVASQQYTVSPDGQRFLINATIEEQTTTPITLMLNWNWKADR